MKCADLEGYWEDWLAGAPAPALEEHLRTCPQCRELAAELARTPEWLRTLREEPLEPGAAFWVRLRERSEETRRSSDFWRALAWAAGRAAAALAVLVLLLAIWVVQLTSEAEMAEFDVPQVIVEEAPGAVPVGNGRLSRDQVVLTLVAQGEKPR